MPLAYVFWHQPRADAIGYETALTRFHARLRVPGLLGSRVVRVPDLPWLRGGGFEDWYYVADFAALGRLNAAAVDTDHAPAHDAVAAMAGPGAGGLYALREGDWQATATHHAWTDRPAPVADGCLWQRQMVLGPAPEYCLVSDVGLDTALVVPVTPLSPPQ